MPPAADDPQVGILPEQGLQVFKMWQQETCLVVIIIMFCGFLIHIQHDIDEDDEEGNETEDEEDEEDTVSHIVHLFMTKITHAGGPSV